MSQYIDFKPGKEIEWLELNSLLTNQPLSKSLIYRLSGNENESEVDAWLSEIGNRATIYNDSPYIIDNNRIIPQKSWDEIPEYFLCLYYSFSGANDYSGGTKLFEKISGEALKNFLNGNIYTLGFPADKGFNEYLNDISNICHENRLMPADSSYKDDGVDVVGYKLFEDNRPGNLYILLQCAAGKHWKQKKPIALNRWTNYILWYPENIIQSISTVDFVDEKNWHKNSSTFGMLIDRIRIFNYLYKREVDTDLRTEVLEWCRTKISNGI